LPSARAALVACSPLEARGLQYGRLRTIPWSMELPNHVDRAFQDKAAALGP